MKFLVLFLFTVTAYANTSRKNLDILFVIDNSGSMQTAQSESCRASGGLLRELKRNKINYHIGVTTTEAWKARFHEDYRVFAQLRDGHGNEHSGVFVITPNTPNAEQVLLTNLTQGIAGSGDERAFDSALQALHLSDNQGFQRNNTPLAIVILSDEDDFSSVLPNEQGEDYDSPNLIPISDFAREFKKLAPRVSVSTIDIPDQACLEKQSPAGNISVRYRSLAKETRGVATSICDISTSMGVVTSHLVKFARK